LNIICVKISEYVKQVWGQPRTSECYIFVNCAELFSVPTCAEKLVGRTCVRCYLYTYSCIWNVSTPRHDRDHLWRYRRSRVKKNWWSAFVHTRHFFQKVLLLSQSSTGSHFTIASTTSRRVLRFKNRRTHVVALFSWEHISVHSLYLDSALVSAFFKYCRANTTSLYIYSWYSYNVGSKCNFNTKYLQNKNHQSFHQLYKILYILFIISYFIL